MNRPHRMQSSTVRGAGLLIGLTVIAIVVVSQFLRSPGITEPESTPAPAFAGDPAAIERGSALFAAQCASCHGASGRGDGPAATALDPKPADFTNSMHRVHPDEGMIAAITNGIPGSAMPSFGESLSATEIAEIVTFIRSLQAQTAGAQISIPAPEDCRIDPVPPISFMPEGTITPKPPPTPAAVVGPDTFPWPQGVAASQTEIDGITRTLREFTACANAGDYPRRLALYTDRAIRPQFDALDEEGWRSALDFAATPAAIAPEGERGWIDSISAVRRLPDGRVGAHVVRIDPVNHPHQSMAVVLFALVGDRWLIDEVHQDTAGPPATSGTPSAGVGIPVVGIETPVTSAGLTMRLAEAPSEAEGGALTVEITGANGDRVDDAEVEFAVEMPTMTMGIQMTSAESQGDGRYSAQIPLGMTGDWQVQVIVNRVGSDTAAAMFHFVID